MKIFNKLKGNKKAMWFVFLLFLYGFIPLLAIFSLNYAFCFASIVYCFENGSVELTEHPFLDSLICGVCFGFTLYISFDCVFSFVKYNFMLFKALYRKHKEKKQGD